MDHEARLVELLNGNERVMRLLRAVRDLGLEWWCIAAGTIRNVVWDDLHGHTEPTLPTDVDVLVFDPGRTDPGYEQQLEARLSTAVPDIRWEVVNQATVHDYTGDAEPYASIEDAMSRWADLVTAVGAHLGPDDELSIIAPGGLRDLFELRVRPNLVTPTAASVYRDRMANKGWRDRWPRLTIEDLAVDRAQPPTLHIQPPTLHILCGLPGSGKTTRAKELEAAGHGVVLNADSWVCRLYPGDREAAARDQRKGLVQDVQWELAERLLTAGISVILDHGVSKRAERDHYRQRARHLGAKVELVFLDPPLETLHRRVAERNLDLPPGTFHISTEELDRWAAAFEPPGSDEMTGP